MSLVKYLIILFITVTIFSCNSPVENKLASRIVNPDTLLVANPDTVKSILEVLPDSFIPVSGQIKRNEVLSSILLKNGISMDEIDRLVKNSSHVFDVKKIRSGNHYTLFLSKDSTSRAKYLIYEHDPVTSFIFSFNDSLNITPLKKEIKSEIKYASAIIHTSLWDAMLNEGLQPYLAVKLSEIYAWSVDFFGLQKGDSFKVIYEELSIDGKPLDIGKIYGTRFSSTDIDIYAIPFVQDGRESFFDSEGNSLRKAFLKAPLQFSRISSRFSPARMHPILRVIRPHYGVDYAAPVGTPVMAIGDGRITQANTDGNSGKVVRIVHNSVYSSAYLHLSRFGQGVAPGAYVKQGDVIGYVGSTGLSTGPHLDFRMYMNGSPVDPMKIEAPPVEPVSPENMLAFEKVKTVVYSLLDTFQ